MPAFLNLFGQNLFSPSGIINLTDSGILLFHKKILLGTKQKPMEQQPKNSENQFGSV
jgi:hypothetical protein